MHQHRTYTEKHDGDPPYYIGRCRDCDRYTSKYWDAADAVIGPHSDDVDYGDVADTSDNEDN